jgi:hypothetical protein
MTEFFKVALPLISLAIAMYVAVEALSDQRFDARVADAGRSRLQPAAPVRGLRKGS